MMVVVRFRAGKERQMVAAVIQHRVHHDEREPDGGRRNVTLHDGRAGKHRQQIADDVLERVRVHGGQGHRGRPFVVLLVHVLVEEARVQQPVAVVERDLPQRDADSKVAHDRERRR